MSDESKKKDSWFNSLVGKTNKVIETGKVKMEIKGYESKINGLYKDIGMIAFEKYKEGQTSFSFSGKDLDPKVKEIEFYRAKINSLKDLD